MSIYQVTKNRIFTPYKLNESLTPGQIIRGKILKLYPQNKAQIQLGNQTLIAQLKAPLSVGESYHFQVQSTDQVIHLSVLSEIDQTKTDQNIKSLLHQLGMTGNRSTVNLLQKIVDLGIPITKTDLLTAQTWLDRVNQKSKGTQVVIDMLKNKLPLTTSIFDALYSKSISNFSSEINQMIKVLNEQQTGTRINQSLLDLLNKITPLSNERSSSQSLMTLSSLIRNNEPIFHLLKEAGSIPQQTTFLSWKKAWDNYFTSQNTKPSTPHSIMPSALLHFNESEAKNLLSHALKLKSNELLIRFENLFSQVQNSSMSVNHDQFNRLKQSILLELIPFMTNDSKQEIKSLLKNENTSLRNLFMVLTQIGNTQPSGNVNSQWVTQLVNSAPQQLFLTHLHTVLSETGLSDEHMLLHNNESKETIKSLLIQLVQQGSPNTNQAQHLLHFINGMQLQSVNETANFIHASIQLPGEKLGLQNDVFIDMESKKNDQGEIDPDFCRILFYLDLAKLKETMIDMHVQKRFVTMTIFNNDPHIRNTSAAMQEALKRGLERLNYQLTTITVKPFKQEMEQRHTQVFNYNQSSLTKGVDLRI